MPRGISLIAWILLVHVCMGAPHVDRLRNPVTLSKLSHTTPQLVRPTRRLLQEQTQFWLQLVFTNPGVTKDSIQAAVEAGVRSSVLNTIFPGISQVQVQDQVAAIAGGAAINVYVQSTGPTKYADVQSQVESPETAADVRQAISAQLGNSDLASVAIAQQYINVDPNAAVNPSPAEGPPVSDGGGEVVLPAPPGVNPAPKKGGGSNNTTLGVAIGLGVGGAALLFLGIACCVWAKKKRSSRQGTKSMYVHHEISKVDSARPVPDVPNGHAHVTVRAAGDPNMATPVKRMGSFDRPASNTSNHHSAFPRVAVADSVFAQKLSPEVPPTSATAPVSATANSNDVHGSPEVQHFVASTPGSASESLHATRSQLLGADSESGELDSSGLRPIRTSGKARVSKTTVALPSAGDAYPLSAECSKMSSREVHRRLRSQSLRSQPTTQDPAPAPVASEPLPPPVADVSARGAQKPSYPSPARAAPVVAAAPAAIVAAPEAPLVEPKAAYGQLTRSTSSLKEPEMTTSPTVPPVSAEPSGSQWNRGVAAPAAGTPPAAGGVGTLKVVRTSRNTYAAGNDDGFSSRLRQNFSRSVAATHGKTPRHRSSGTNSPSEVSSEWGVSATLSVGHSASSFSSVSVMSEATTVYTDIGQGDIDDKVTQVERLLNRAQQELGGQVGSFRLKGPRYRFAGRSSVVAFAEGMWGGDYALKFYCDPQAAEREFNIYRQATELNMSLPDVQEIEDNAGGVLRLRDGTPLPPFMAMLRGLPLPEWYALHVPSQIAILETLSQVLKRLEQLHASGFCHNDIKPANILLLDGPNGGLPRWHLVDFTSIAQVGSQIRARYTLEYVSPEVVRAVGAMRAHTIACQRSMDIWSIGVIMYELLTSEPFFPLDAGRDMMRDGLMGLEPLPIEEDPRSIMRIPKEGKLRSTVMSMLSREPASRPSATKVVQAIHDCIKEITGESPNYHDEETPLSSVDASTSFNASAA